VAGSQTNSLYARFNMSSGLLSTLYSRMAPVNCGALEVSVLLDKLQTTAYDGLAHAFRIVSARLRHKNSLCLTINRNGYRRNAQLSLEEARDLAHSTLDELVKQLGEQFPSSQQIIIHLGMYVPSKRRCLWNICLVLFSRRH